MNNFSDAILPTIANGENQDMEFKSKTHAVGETICSFANTNDGTILVGVLDNGDIVGSSKKDEQVIANIAHTCKPSIYPLINSVEACGKNIFVVKVKKSNQIHSFKNIAYMRVGTHDKPLSAEELIEFAREKKTFEFDSQVCEDASLEDIDKEKVKRYIEKRGIEKPKEMNLDAFLFSIRAADSKKGNKPTNGGILFLGKNPQKFFLQTRIHCVKFDGNEISRNTTDELMCDGTLWEMLNDAENFVNKNVRLYGFRTEISFRRIEKLEYPLRAIREAIVNALIHREYSEPSEIKLFIFDDRLEIINPGSFPEGVTPHNPVHKPRNPLLCEYMKDIHYIEKYGSGIYLMRKLCSEWGILEPEYELDRYWTKIIFRQSKAGILLSEIIKHEIELNNRQINAVKYIFEHNSITNEEYQKINNIKRTTSKIELRELVDKGLFDVRGKGKGTRYILSMTIK